MTSQHAPLILIIRNFYSLYTSYSPISANYTELLDNRMESISTIKPATRKAHSSKCMPQLLISKKVNVLHFQLFQKHFLAFQAKNREVL